MVILCLHVASDGMLKWLKAPALPRPFVLDLLDFVLANSAGVFRYVVTLHHYRLSRSDGIADDCLLLCVAILHKLSDKPRPLSN